MSMSCFYLAWKIAINIEKPAYLKRLDKTNNFKMNKVFVYGTLKSSQPNYWELASRNAKFVAEAVTVDKMPLIVATDIHLPFLLYKKDYGKVCIC